MLRRQFLILSAAVAASSTLIVPLAAGGNLNFDEAAFAAAQQAGRPILIEISAPWCPTCRAQKPIIEDLAGRPDFQDLLVMEVDFDSRKDLVRAFDARSQSTLIMFRGRTETGRSVGDTDPDRIEALVRSAFAD